MYTQAQAGCSGASEGGRAWRAGRDIGTAFLPPSLACPNGTRAQRTFSAKELSSAAAASGAMALSLTTVGRQANALAPAKGGAGPDMGPRLCGHAVCCQAAGHQAADTGSCYGRSFAIDGRQSEPIDGPQGPGHVISTRNFCRNFEKFREISTGRRQESKDWCAGPLRAGTAAETALDAPRRCQTPPDASSTAHEAAQYHIGPWARFRQLRGRIRACHVIPS